MVEILNVGALSKLRVVPKGILGVCGFVSAIEGPHKWSESTDWRLSIRLTWFSRQSEDELFIAEHVFLWIWTSGTSDSFQLELIPAVRPGDFLVALPCSLKPTTDGFVVQMSARQAAKRVILVTPSDRAGSWESFRPLCSVNKEKNLQLYKLIKTELQPSMEELSNTPAALISSLADSSESEVFGIIMNVVLVGKQQEGIEIILTIFVEDSESWSDIPRDNFRGQKLSLLGDDLAQYFPSSFLNFRQVLLKSSSAQSAIAQYVQPGKFISLTGSQLTQPFEYIRPSDNYKNDNEKICCSDVSKPNQSLMVLDETCPAGIKLLQKLRNSDRPAKN